MYPAPPRSSIMVIIETLVFTRQVRKLLSDDEYQQLQLELVERPDLGVVIQGSGGLRKVRWAAKGHGKRGGSRVIYYWAVSQDQILMLLIYPKNVQDDLSPAQLSALRKAVEAEFHER
jgi:mRNA-degrading endonuclease RelE of RelBE toxin-antitoxin system